MLLDDAMTVRGRGSSDIEQAALPHAHASVAQQPGRRACRGGRAARRETPSNPLLPDDLQRLFESRARWRESCSLWVLASHRAHRSRLRSAKHGMNSSWRRVIIGGVFFGLTCVAAVSGYMAAGWNMLDAVYMVVITVFGVGYGETKPLDNPTLKVFTMGVIVAGCSSGIYVVGGFVQMLAEGEINRVLGTRRMSKGIEQLTGHTIICGYGRVGQMLAADLTDARHPFVVIDSSEHRVAEAQAAGCLAILGSASEERHVGIRRHRPRQGHGSRAIGRHGQRLRHPYGARSKPHDPDHRPGRIRFDREEADAFGGEPRGAAGADRRHQDRAHDRSTIGRGLAAGSGGQDAAERRTAANRPRADRNSTGQRLAVGGAEGGQCRSQRPRGLCRRGPQEARRLDGVRFPTPESSWGRGMYS